MNIFVTMYKKLLFTTVYPLIIIIAFIDGFATKIITPYTKRNNRIYTEENKCSFQIAVVGDLQRTSHRECLFGKESNDIERKEIVENIKEQKPGSVILLGDIVFEGDYIDHWECFDSLMIPLNEEHIPLLPIINNRESCG